MLTPDSRRELRALAHDLKPVAMIGQAGLSEAVLAEVERALQAHELVKIRVLGDDREGRDALLAALCEALSAAPVQHIGRMLVLFRERRDEPVAVQDPAPAARRRSAPKSGAAAPPVDERRARSGGYARPSADAPPIPRKKPAVRPSGSAGQARAAAGRSNQSAATDDRPAGPDIARVKRAVAEARPAGRRPRSAEGDERRKRATDEPRTASSQRRERGTDEPRAASGQRRERGTGEPRAASGQRRERGTGEPRAASSQRRERGTGEPGSAGSKTRAARPPQDERETRRPAAPRAGLPQRPASAPAAARSRRRPTDAGPPPTPSARRPRTK